MPAARRHEYTAELVWDGDRGTGTSDYTSYGRGFRVAIAGKPDLVGSADAAFRGEPDRHNPEELLLAAVSACHMLVYLALCARNGIAVTGYSDAAHGTLAVEPGGGGRFEEIVLEPRVTVAPASDHRVAEALHARARELCFIANSCNFPIRHRAEVRQP